MPLNWAARIEHMFDPGLLLRHVQDVQKVLRLQLRRLVPGDVPVAEAADMWAASDAIERQAAAAKTLLAGRVAESQAWARAGDRSAEEHLARTAGTSRGRHVAAWRAPSSCTTCRGPRPRCGAASCRKPRPRRSPRRQR